MGSGGSKSVSYNYKLTYFNARGRGEVARLCFAVAGVKYEDIRIEQADWPELKPKTPLGFLPVLTINGNELTQKLVIDRFLAGQFGLLGSSDLERCKIDEVMTTITDFAVQLSGTFFIQEEEAKATAVKDILDTKLAPIMAYIEKTMNENKTQSGYIVGGKLSVADLSIFNCLETLTNLSPTALDEYTRIRDLNTKIGIISSIAKYVASRPKTPI
ncbi:HPGDS [Mytilus edulis]|uniref:HPGDS n=1 Tax=Mytilus edulis TaxID=6550 RepID=A0A8S3S9T0_MYTED|nr:HPGDS [Mytilus edulis]